MASYAPLHVTFNEKPRTILKEMQALTDRREATQSAYQRRRWLPLFLLLAGIPFVCVDLAIIGMGFTVLVFSFVTLFFWLAALVAFIALRRARTQVFPPRFDLARQVIDTLQDDLDPRRNFFGQLDLTGTRQEAKIGRSGKDGYGRTNLLYRDEWLNLKTRLYDGNMLRLSAVRREKLRKGYWKRSTSGKTKWKGEKHKGALEELKLRVTVNPEVYDPSQTGWLQPNTAIGSYLVEAFDNSNGAIQLLARTDRDDISAQDVLAVLRTTYNLLHRKAVA